MDQPRDESGRMSTQVGGAASAGVDWRMSTDRRNAFRELIRRLDPAEKPQRAMEQGFYVEPGSSISERIATRLELSPTSTHMLIGGIGSGKTTQLLRVRERLEEVGDVRAFFVDVFQRQQLASLARPGVLLALAGLEVESAASPIVTGTAAQEIEVERNVLVHIAEGRWIDIQDAIMEEDVSRMPDDYVWRPGIIAPPPEQEELTRLEEAIRAICAVLPFQPVLLFDGLDRVVDVSQFISLLSMDLPMLKRVGIGVVAVAPQHARTWDHGAAQDLFDETHLHGAAHIGGNDGIRFLHQVLLTRTAHSALLPSETCNLLAAKSGGIVRDLLSLARAAAEEAYRLGADTIEAQHVRTAAEQFGRNLVVGISDEMIDRLKSLPPQHGAQLPFSFTPATDIDIRLLLRRLVIEIPSAPVRYILHPTIVPLIPGLRGRR